MAQSAKSNTPSITPVVWDVRMARPLSKSGPTSTKLLCPLERWDPVHDILHWMTAGVAGIGERSSEWVSLVSVPAVQLRIAS